MNQRIRVAILIEDFYQDLEVWYPLLRLREEGFEVVTVEPNGRKDYKGKNGYPIEVDKKIDQVDNNVRNLAVKVDRNQLAFMSNMEDLNQRVTTLEATVR